MLIRMVAVTTGSAPPVPVEWWDRFEPPEGYRAEVIRGELVVTPAPSNAHQYATGELFAALRAAVRTSSDEYAVLPGGAWQLAERGLVAQAPQPDVVVRRWEGPDIPDGTPLLAVEVLSPSDGVRLSEGMTRIEGKRLDYAVHGLTDYLEIEPYGDGYVARRYELVSGRLVVVDAVGVGGVLVATRPFAFEVHLEDLVRRRPGGRAAGGVGAGTPADPG
jgi:Uma2 family endonuclease